MESRSRLGELSRYVGELFHYLQDPHLVARFQRICGVHGTFSGPAGSSKAGQRTDLHTSGARCRHARVGKESAGSPFEGAGEGDNVRRTEPEVRKSSDTNLAEVHGERYDVRPQNGCAATSGGQTVGAAGEGGSPRGAADGGRTRTGVADPPGSSTVKPRRKNSLTGDAGQEFVIENRFLYYLFSFGTELGNELFYIIFFPFLTWNLEAFVSRRLVMVWVWVMYLGQCTKDVIGWSRPASPPVVKVEMFYNSEYSMPSTHAMSGTAIPFALFFMTCSRWEFLVPAARLRNQKMSLNRCSHVTPCSGFTSTVPGPTGLQPGSVLVSAGLCQPDLHGNALGPGRHSGGPVQCPDPDPDPVPAGAGPDGQLQPYVPLRATRHRLSPSGPGPLLLHAGHVEHLTGRHRSDPGRGGRRGPGVAPQPPAGPDA
ncbi:sphingosine-1-phosphate phosphatase 1 isoform X2 [Takifugu flavidus]|uniref:sphingosine-1-phosphate phosphatase 1 isoform X2 n=1 Tax=Takifugu flavidus TaxID=433684 RepID=UPI0025441D0F|nr:sphingosine-1-phosphate phosphatase 1 isoform X2 [Takifugu flavidus]